MAENEYNLEADILRRLDDASEGGICPVCFGMGKFYAQMKHLADCEDCGATGDWLEYIKRHPEHNIHED